MADFAGEGFDPPAPMMQDGDDVGEVTGEQITTCQD